MDWKRVMLAVVLGLVLQSTLRAQSFCQFNTVHSGGACYECYCVGGCRCDYYEDYLPCEPREDFYMYGCWAYNWEQIDGGEDNCVYTCCDLYSWSCMT
jgi:hypothetical protein